MLDPTTCRLFSFHGRKAIESLDVAVDLRNWLAADLSRQRIDLSDLEEAALFVRYRFGLAKRDQSSIAIPCHMICVSRVRTAENAYTHRAESSQAWRVRHQALPSGYARIMLFLKSLFVSGGAMETDAA